MSDATVKISQNLQGLAEGLDDVLEEIAGEKQGFILLTFPLNSDETEVQYVSNAERDGAIEAIAELQRRWQEGEPDTPYHEKH